MAPKKGKAPRGKPGGSAPPQNEQNPTEGSSLSLAPQNRTCTELQAIAVEIRPLASLAISPSSCSTSGSAHSTSGGYNTPMTTTNPTPTESDSMPSARPKRVSASVRALELRNSSLGLGTRRKRGTKELIVPDSLSESSDARLALALQAEEYAQDFDPKRRKISTFSSGNRREVQNSTDDDDADFPDLSSPLTNDGHLNPSKSTHHTSMSRTISRVIRDTESPLTDIDIGNSPIDFNYSDDSENWNEFHHYGGLTESDVDSLDGLNSDINNQPIPSVTSSINQARQRRRLTRAEKERKKLEQQHPAVETMWEDLEKIRILAPPPAPQPSGISRKLKPFQLEGLSWMMEQEKSKWKGGLLGDEMGMGKTIQAVSLLMSDYPVGIPSLVVVPPVALMQWQAEIESYTDGKLKVFVYHGSNSKVKNITAKQLKSYDVIMISYSGLESMHRKEVKGWTRGKGLVKEDSIIHSIRFHRLVLDEAHNIKQRTTSVARACFALKAEYKWCLSGTPVQNRIGEFFSLLRFLDVKPFACYFCKKCPCEQLHWSQDEHKRCLHCNHTGFDHVSIFNQEILNPITTPGSSGKRKDALDKLRLITDRIMLRRVKKDHTFSMELPPKRVQIHNEFFGEIERDFSTSIMTNSTRQFDTYVSRGVMLNNYANIFGLIMQMRQVANHPDLILKKHAEGGQNVLVCSICDEPAEEAIRSRCKHEFCRQCAKEYIQSFESRGEPDCPRCHIPLSIDFEQPDIEQEEGEVKKNSIINRIKMEDWTSSTKIEMLVYDLYKLRSKKQTHKSIVFSQFTSMLQLVEWRLHRAGISTVMLDGSMTPVQRQKSIEYFMNNVDVEVFLVSLRAGGVALNLTEASRVFIVDPWWNPAAEWQSADRCHRIGQRRPCVITKLCIEDSVESRMVLLQEKKANMINGTINKDQSEALEKLTPEDMEFLFRGT
ncbi:DNA repair protein rad16 [Ophidiomyces ophidiicola]|uniref:DNA repair protein rad16 n=1 Tax=Ophidiomyces ophidiicola TaxID=1387563 RepID=UPI0020C4A4CB|nr:DNA repair protein rad16 [Ophidiomyces ophidiicola]KAI1946060.1 DNA repair protein rad16 [Ophidiomyces ophidiicola]KAI1968857.1 DNA repair protein rad16 [Ophidiomyces ophidiicola]KAI2015087.1 DNA repair protein rad16 [Ophidiomyces ophidiicola]KAI2024315.1 DNA repair protein rad16 [Ophidiomyces ophidiicola]KAI2050743.1 DNA repair protein rad16 [Ophidiomyces ophidiicola]